MKLIMTREEAGIFLQKAIPGETFGNDVKIGSVRVDYTGELTLNIVPADQVPKEGD